MLYAVISGFVAAALLPLLHRYLGERSSLVVALTATREGAVWQMPAMAA